MNDLSEGDFKYWSGLDVTKMMIKILQDKIEGLEQVMKSTTTILKPEAQVVLANLAGQRDALNLVISITAEDIL